MIINVKFFIFDDLYKKNILTKRMRQMNINIIQVLIFLYYLKNVYMVKIIHFIHIKEFKKGKFTEEKK